MNSLTVPEIVRHERKRLGWTLIKTQDATGVSHPYLSQIETGKIKNVSPGILQKLADGMGISYHELMVAAGYIRQGAS